MSGLTEEQRHRMEENRLKALQKRSKQKISSDGNLSSVPTGSGVHSSSNNTVIALQSNKHPSSGCQPSASESDIKPSYSGSTTFQPSSTVMSAANDSTMQAFNSKSVKPAPKGLNSNVCTDEAKRIEENRRKALERRAAQQKNIPGNPRPNTHPSNQQNSSYTSASSPEIYSNDQLSLPQKPVAGFYKKSQTKDSTVLSHSGISGDGPSGEAQSTGMKENLI